MVLNTEWAQVEVIDLINDGSGLAFGIIGGRSTGVVVKTILPGGVADRDGRLQSGDHILQIGEVNLRGLGSEQVASVLRQCGVHVRMVVARPVESASINIQDLNSQAPIVPTKIIGDPVELDRHLIENGYAGTCALIPSIPYVPIIYGQQNLISDIVDVVRNPLPIGNVPVPKICPPPPPKSPTFPENVKNLDSPETEIFTIELKKDDLGLGITVAGYVCEKEEISGIFVKSISKGSAADAKKSIKVNDRIIEVNGTSVIGYTNHQAVEFLKNAGPIVKIKFERYLRGPKYEQLQQAIKANELRPPSPPSPTVSSLPKVPLSLVHMSYLGIEPEGESRTSIDFDSTVVFDSTSPVDEEKEIVIDGRKSLQFSIASHESIYDKWKEKVKKDAEIVIAQMHKPESSGLGISLEGTVDVEDGREVRPHHYIRNILPDGPVGLNGTLQSGDELLEVNGIQLLGLNHLEVVSILKQLPTFVSLVCARYPVPIRIIDTSQHPDAFQARKILADSLQTLIQPGEQTRLVKAKSETSIASSVGSDACTLSRSRSLELTAGLPMWCEEATIVELNKGDHGLGFSILDYQDPINPQETVIVIRSLVPGGVAQADGRLIPGDRLMAVNDINLEHATLDTAVQALKGAPKGMVKIFVAKPINGGDTVSQASQGTEDDQTCFEDFQECIEEFQEDLIGVPIFIEDDHSFNHSPCTSQVEDFGQKNNTLHKHVEISDILQNNFLNIKELNRDSIGDSDIDISFKSTNDNCLDNSEKNGGCENIQVVLKNQNAVTLQKGDSLNYSEKPSLSEKDGYETCIDESLSDDNTQVECSRVTKVKILDNVVNIEIIDESCDLDDVTPTNSKIDISNSNLSNQNLPKSSAKNHVPSSSEPCLPTDYFPNSKQICLDSKLEELKSYDNHETSGICEGDEFFLVQFPANPPKEVCKSVSEPNVLETYEIPVSNKLTYKLREYYNDYEDCLDAYKNITVYEKLETEMSDSEIFNEIFLPFKSKSAPNVMDRSFVTLTYDPGPDLSRRKSAFVAGYPNNESEMTVIRHNEPDYGIMKGYQNNVLHKHWGSTHVVKVFREPQKSLGISIVGGKVDVQPSEKQAEAFLGIFVKNVTPRSPAAKTGQFKTGDRILEVSGIDLREATHEKAVDAIKNAPNPVVFLVQSLIPWTNSENANNLPNENESQSPYSSFTSQKSLSNQKHLENHDDNDNLKIAKKTEDSPLRRNVISQINSYETGESVDDKSTSDVQNYTKKVSSLSDESGSDDDEMDTGELEGRTVSTQGEQIDRASAANIRRSKEEIQADKEDEDVFGYTTNKVKKKYGNLGHTILMVQLERDTGGLGLSLAGHRDRSCMAVFVCGLNPNGAAYKTGSIQIGDEILEVNGVVLHGRCHLNASAIIKSLSGPVFKVIILRLENRLQIWPLCEYPPLWVSIDCFCFFFGGTGRIRRKNTTTPVPVSTSVVIGCQKCQIYRWPQINTTRKAAINDIAVKPITQFPVSLAEEVSEEHFSANYPNVRTVAVRKASHSLGIMIIEGKHAEVGQGIFISDIQEGSAAEKAGLEIGEMILAVNKDSLVGSNYDTAANLLKRTEGLVTLVVSNPGKKDPARALTPTPSAQANNVADGKLHGKPSLLTPTTPSRPTTPVPEPAADPLTCPIIPGRETAVEINTNNETLGICFIGGKDTVISDGIIITEVYSGGQADKDGRLQPGDQILEVNGTSLRDCTNTTASQALRQTLPKMKITVLRPSNLEYTPIEVDLVKKPGKGLGLSVVGRKSGKGVYVADIIPGSSAEADNRITKGDILISVNGQSVENLTSEEAGAILKTVMGKVSLKLRRYKPSTSKQ